MNDLSWLDGLEGIEETGSQAEQIEGFKRFQGLNVWNLNGRTGDYSQGEERSQQLFGAILAYSEVRTLFVGMSTPPAWEIELAKHTLPSSTPLCSWEGGNHRPGINSNLERTHQSVLEGYGAGSSCRHCSLGQWQRVEGKPIKPACTAKAAILFLPLVGPDFKAFAEAPVVVQVNNYRSVDKVLGKYSKTEPLSSIQEEADQYSMQEFKRMVPLLALRAKLFSESFGTKNGDFFQLSFSFHQVFGQAQVKQALAVFKANNVFKAEELTALPPAKTAPALPAPATVQEAEFTSHVAIDSVPF